MRPPDFQFSHFTFQLNHYFRAKYPPIPTAPVKNRSIEALEMRIVITVMTVCVMNMYRNNPDGDKLRGVRRMR